jgi:DNA primase
MNNKVINLLSKANVAVQMHGIDEVAVYCPFHRNTDSASCYINTKTGLWQCFNPSCGAKGNYRQLYRRLLHKDVKEREVVEPASLRYKLNESLKKRQDVLEMSLEGISIDYESDIDILATLISRGFHADTLEEFEVGFSEKKNRIVLPVRDERFRLIAMIGRAISDDQDPRYLYSRGFKRAKVVYNLCNAKKYDSVIVTEGSLDAIKIHQAGFPNVVATLGSKVSEEQFSLLRKYFDEIIAFPDKDDAGFAMGRSIIVSCRGKRIRWAECPEGKSDPGEMTAEEISEAVNNSKIKI